MEETESRKLKLRVSGALLALPGMVLLACTLVTVESYEQACVLGPPAFAACEKFLIVAPLHLIVTLACFGGALIPWIFMTPARTSQVILGVVRVAAIAGSASLVHGWVSWAEYGPTEAWPLRLAVFVGSITVGGVCILLAQRWANKLKGASSLRTRQDPAANREPMP
jgi:hypothetical protein